jgi:hypothetical protein
MSDAPSMFVYADLRWTPENILPSLKAFQRVGQEISAMDGEALDTRGVQHSTQSSALIYSMIGTSVDRHRESNLQWHTTAQHTPGSRRHCPRHCSGTEKRHPLWFEVCLRAAAFTLGLHHLISFREEARHILKIAYVVQKRSNRPLGPPLTSSA